MRILETASSIIDLIDAAAAEVEIRDWSLIFISEE